MTQRASLFSALNALSDEIGQQKSAAAAGNGLRKQAGPTPADPGGHDGPTTHPSKDADNGTQVASEGARSSENEKDVKEDQGAPGVNSGSDATVEGRQDEVQIGQNTKAKATGEDPSAEDNYKGNHSDNSEGGRGGTTHPATTEGNEKYSAYSFKQAHSRFTNLSNELLADFANGFGTRLDQKPVAPGTKQAAASGHASPANTDMAAGYALAEALGLEKGATVAAVEDCLTQTIVDAETDADLVGAYLTQFNKQAAEGDDDESQSGEDHSAPGDDASGAGDAAGLGDPGAAPEADPLAGLGGAGGAPGGMPGGDPLGGLGGAGGAGGDPLGGAPPSEDEALQELAMALEELGIPVEALAAAAGGAGGPPGGDPMGASPAGAGPAAPPALPTEEAMPDGAKLAAAVQHFKRSGKFQFKEARTKRSRALRDNMKSHVLELLR